MQATGAGLVPRPRSLVASLVATAALVLSACGGADEAADTPGVASVEDLAPTTTSTAPAADADSAAASSSSTTEAAPTTSAAMSPIEEQELALLDLSACMRDEGIDGFPDLSVDNNGAIDVAAVFQAGINPQDPDVAAAIEVCDDNVADITFGAAAVPDPAAIVDQLFTFTQCLRDEGIDAGDVALTELLGRRNNVPADVASREEGIAYFFEVDPDDPAVIEAIGACEGNLAGLPGAG